VTDRASAVPSTSLVKNAIEAADVLPAFRCVASLLRPMERVDVLPLVARIETSLLTSHFGGG
jgi:hypothetical protein